MQPEPVRGGLLVLRKPPGPTSHDCVGRLRRLLGVRRIGHAGTLDPLAEGVLVMGIGTGTRLLEYLGGLPKRYRARLRFGRRTDSQDITGAVLTESDASGVTEEAVLQALDAFRGEILQTPPMVSAVKHEGRRLYELARAGEVVERQPRPVEITQLDLTAFRPGSAPEAELVVQCSGGTYIRTLCHDLGEALAVGATMSALTREAVGPYLLEDAIPLDELTNETAWSAVRCPASAVAHLPRLTLGPDEAARLCLGQRRLVPAEMCSLGIGNPIAVFAESGTLLAVGQLKVQDGALVLSPLKVIDAASPISPALTPLAGTP